ncbi:MAG: metal ABC transporter permease [Deltaproteobacteria bacterium]|nr:metal ABC transporter permease [Deltaproteobacteria bacterium]
MAEMFGYGFVQRALVASALVGTACSLIGVYVILRGLAFIGDGMAHAAFAGVALGFLVGQNPMLVAVAFCLGITGAIHVTSRRGRMKMDASIGVFYALAMALGILFVGLRRSYDARLYGYLFGSILTVTPTDLQIIGVLTASVAAAVILLFKEFQLLSFDPEMAEALGLPAKWLSFAMLLLVSLTIVVSMQAVGVMLAFALVVIPASAAYQLTYSYRALFVLSILFGNASCFLGLVLSYYFDLPSGATIVLTASGLFFASLLLSPKRRGGTVGA